MTYTYRTYDERHQIAILAKARHGQSAIAQLMNRHNLTISRELRRNRCGRDYKPKQKPEFSKEACIMAFENDPRVAAKTWTMVEANLDLTWSPQQISGYLKINGPPSVSHESIHRYATSNPSLPKSSQETLRRARATRHDTQSDL